MISPHDPKVIYHAANVLFRTTDAGRRGQAISPDLTRNDKSKQKWSGGPITGDNTGVEIYGTIFALAESPKQKGLLWAGSDDGMVHVTRDGGKTWNNVTPNIKPAGMGHGQAASSRRRSTRTRPIVVVDAHRLDDMRPYLFEDHRRRQDVGKPVGETAAGNVYLRAVREDPKKKGLLYLGTEHGIASSTDAGETWKPLKLNLPTVPVCDLAVKDDDLVVGTSGRSMWIFDDLTPLREMGPAVEAKGSTCSRRGRPTVTAIPGRSRRRRRAARSTTRRRGRSCTTS